MYTDPVTFSDVFLERPNEDYAKWILLPKSWGGAIELAILSEHYSTEIAAFDVSTTRMDCYGM
jgi:ubiquitin thioesterase OTU1